MDGIGDKEATPKQQRTCPKQVREIDLPEDGGVKGAEEVGEIDG